MTRDVTSRRNALTRSCLEAARREVVQRLRGQKLPTRVPVQRLIIVDNDEGTGWSSAWETVYVSPLQFLSNQVAVQDGSVPTRLIGLRDELMPLAEFLAEMTDLGAKQSSGLFPNATGPEATLVRVANPLALSYLHQLPDLGRPSESRLRSLSADLGALCNATKVVHTRQVVLAGLRTRRRLGPYRGVAVRPLTASERGEFLMQYDPNWMERPTTTPNFVVPRRFSMFMPSVLLDVRTSRGRGESFDDSTLANRITLAFYLCGFDISGAGSWVGWDEPRWAFMGASHGQLAVGERPFVTDRFIAKTSFKRVVDLAYRMPDFSGIEGSAREVALYRILRGCAASDSGFLDYAIGLEAALVGGVTTELAYRFSLNGAIFLSDERDPKVTFESLRNIYAVRSKLVHGAPIKPAARATAEADAADLARAVAKRAVESGWPDDASLRDRALGSQRGRKP